MNQSTPLFSIITPTYKRPELLERAIVSVRAQTCEDWEMCIVDNTSPDETLDMIASFNDIRLRVEQIQNDGIIARSRNRALEMARGQYLAFLDSDDWWQRNKLETAQRYLTSGAELFYHDLRIVSQHRALLKFPTLGARALPESDVAAGLARMGGVIPNSSVVINRTLYDRIGPISEDTALVAAEDYDYWMRCAELTDAFCFVPEYLGCYWHTSGSMTQAHHTISWGTALRKKYPQYDFPWLSYKMARAWFDEGNYRNAKSELRRRNSANQGFRLGIRCLALSAILLTKPQGAGQHL